MNHFKGKQFQQDVIIVAVGYYLRYNLSYREVQEILYDRGINVSHTTIYRWVQEYGKLLYQIWKKKINREKEENFPKKLKGTRGMIEIRKAHNPGFSMGRLSRFPFLVRFLSVFATFFLFFSLPYFTYLTGDSFFLQELGTALVLSGAASNTLDMVRDC